MSRGLEFAPDRSVYEHTRATESGPCPLVAPLGASGRISRGTVPRRDSPRNLVGEESRVADRDSTTHRAFFEYYASESQRDQIVERFVTARDLVLRALKEKGDSLDVADLG